jgi:hypothetical protein
MMVTNQGYGVSMSRVTNAIVTAHVGPHSDSDPEIDSVNKFLRETEGGGAGAFVEVSQHAGGTKHMECRVYVSAFNHADTNVIVRAVDQAPWRDKGNGAVIHQGQLAKWEEEADQSRETRKPNNNGK